MGLLRVWAARVHPLHTRESGSVWVFSSVLGRYIHLHHRNSNFSLKLLNNNY